jgi:hypothetical protein
MVCGKVVVTHVELFKNSPHVVLLTHENAIINAKKFNSQIKI